MITIRCMILAVLASVGCIKSNMVEAFTVTAPTAHIAATAPFVTTTLATTTAAPSVSYQQALNNGIRSYLDETNIVSKNVDASSSASYSRSSSTGSSVMLSLQERKIPTKEEIDQKKFNFNVIFWGGGFVAPFIATVFYFGFRFWEK